MNEYSGNNYGRTIPFIYFIGIFIYLLHVFPVFEIGFYQDDFKNFVLYRKFGWDIITPIVNSGIDQGFRPLLFIDKQILYNLIGENVFLYRLFAIMVHLIHPFLLYKIASNLGFSTLQRALVVFFYFLCFGFYLQLTYSLVAFSLADLLTLLVIHLTIKYILIESRRSTMILLGILFFSAYALFNKENGIAASLASIFLFVAYWNKIPKLQRIVVPTIQIMTIGIYFVFYFSNTSTETSNSIASSNISFFNVKFIFTGWFFSLTLPIANIYKILRVADSPVILSGLTVIVVTLSVFLNKSTVQGIKLAISKPIFWYLSIVTAIILAPYFLNAYFENRMMLISGCMGFILWGWLFGYILESTDFSKPNLAVKVSGFALIVILFVNTKSKISNEIYDSVWLADAIKKELNDSLDLPPQEIVLVGFQSRGLLRSGNAKGLVEWLFGEAIKVHRYSTIEKVPESLEGTIKLINFLGEEKELGIEKPFDVLLPGE